MCFWPFLDVSKPAPLEQILQPHVAGSFTLLP
jgi:hypothetical protein